MIEALTEYDVALRDAQSLSLVTTDGRHIGLDVARWRAPVDAADETVLALCRPPVLDVGCGPGRFVAELGARGLPALGVDIAQAAVALTRQRGGAAVLRNAFSTLPGEGRWPTILLMDGNVGIGGDPVRLLRRMGEALAFRGQLLVEVDPDPSRDEIIDVRFVRDRTPVGRSFRWALVGVQALELHAAMIGARVTAHWREAGRAFARVTIDGHARP